MERTDAPQQVTAIRPTARDPGRASVRVGGKVVATLSMRRIEDLGLHVGQPWDTALAARVAAAVEQDKAMRQALNRLARRAMSRRELDRKLRERGFDEPVREHVLDRLTELGHIDDEQFGRALIEDVRRSRAAGPRLLEQKLFQKGLDRTLIAQLIAETRNDANESDQAMQLAHQKLRQMQRLDANTRRRRLYGLLARRGFDAETIDHVMQSVSRDVEA